MDDSPAIQQPPINPPVTPGAGPQAGQFAAAPADRLMTVAQFEAAHFGADSLLKKYTIEYDPSTVEVISRDTAGNENSDSNLSLKDFTALMQGSKDVACEIKARYAPVGGISGRRQWEMKNSADFIASLTDADNRDTPSTFQSFIAAEFPREA